MYRPAISRSALAAVWMEPWIVMRSGRHPAGRWA